jgi:hypothetical protein
LEEVFLYSAVACLTTKHSNSPKDKTERTKSSGGF